MKIMELKEELDSIDREKVTKEKFWGIGGADADDEEFDYGRDTLKEGNFEKYIIEAELIPYENLSLYTKPSWSFFGVGGAQ